MHAPAPFPSPGVPATAAARAPRPPSVPLSQQMMKAAPPTRLGGAGRTPTHGGVHICASDLLQKNWIICSPANSLGDRTYSSTLEYYVCVHTWKSLVGVPVLKAHNPTAYYMIKLNMPNGGMAYTCTAHAAYGRHKFNFWGGISLHMPA